MKYFPGIPAKAGIQFYDSFKQTGFPLTRECLWFFCFLFASCFVPQALIASSTQHFEEYPIAVLQSLDKMNARVQKLDAPIGKEFSLGPLDIVVKTCRKTPPEDTPPEAVAYMEIRDSRFREEELQLLFQGWMFASSPALSALEHPNYDVWVLDCKKPETKERSPSKPSSTPKKASPPKAEDKSE
jgi:hypothetical protein